MSRETITLAIDADLAARIRATGREPSEVALEALRREAHPRRGAFDWAQWRAENAEAIAAYNDAVALRGTLSERHRRPSGL